MSETVKKGFSLTILTTISTSLALTLIYGLGNYTVKAHDTAIDVKYVKDQMETMNESLVEIVTLGYESRQNIQIHDLRLKHCEKWQEKCETLYEKDK